MSSKILVGAVLVSGLFASMTLGEVFLDRTENIVGYADVELRPGHNLLAVPFQDIGSTNGVVDIQSAIRSSELTGMDWSTGSGGDFIKLWNPQLAVYDSTSHWAGAADTTPYLGYDVSNTWIDPATLTPSDIDLPLGRAFWLAVNAPSNILGTFSGEVARADAHSVYVLPGGNVLGAPHPREIDIQDVRSNDFLGFDAAYDFQTTLSAWTGSGYATYGWCADGQGSAEGVPEFDAKWLLDDFSDVAIRTFDLGEGFWIFTSTNGAIAFENAGLAPPGVSGTSLAFTECTRQTNGVLLRIACPANAWWYNRIVPFNVFCKERLSDSRWFFVGQAIKPSGSSVAQAFIPGAVLPVWSAELSVGGGIQPHVVTNYVFANDRTFDVAGLLHRLTPLPGLVQTNFMNVAERPRSIPERYLFIAVFDQSHDADDDGLSDDFEVLQAGTDPENSDSDGDGMNDCWEFYNGLDPLNPNGVNGPHGDPDGDGLTNFEEYTRNPYLVPVMEDTDGDGMSDGWEIAHGLAPWNSTDALVDTDGDGLANLEEYQNGSDPMNPDTDGDGMPDGWEVSNGFDPRSGLLDSLQGWWRFQESNGTVSADLSGNGNGAFIVFSNKVDWVMDAPVGGALHFDADPTGVPVSYDGGFVCVPGLSNAVMSSGFTVAAWVRADSYPSYATIFTKATDHSDWTDGMSLYQQDGGTLSFYAGSWPDSHVSSGVSTTGRWMHVCGVYDGTNQMIYVDGVLCGTETNTVGNVDTQDPLWIGSTFKGSPWLWDGDIADARYYGAALSASAISSLHEFAADSDGDGLSNLEEYQRYCEPHIADTDGDGMPDGWEVEQGLNPLDPSDYWMDKDDDGLSNAHEYELGTDPNDPDSDSDGIPDGWEDENSLDPADPADAALDFDGDGLTNLEEYSTGTDPNVFDTDLDGIGDGLGVLHGLDPMDPLDASMDSPEPYVPWLCYARSNEFARIYVDCGYTGSNGLSDGSSSRPWTNLQDAGNAAAGIGPVLVLVAPGYYTGEANSGLIIDRSNYVVAGMGPRGSVVFGAISSGISLVGCEDYSTLLVNLAFADTPMMGAVRICGIGNGDGFGAVKRCVFKSRGKEIPP